MKHYKLKVIGIVAMLLSSIILIRKIDAQRYPLGVLTGQLNGKNGTIIKFNYNYHGKEFMDSVILKDNYFVFKIRLPEPLLCTLSNNENKQIKIFIAQNNRISINGEVSKFVNINIANATENALYENFKSKELILSNNYRENFKISKLSLKDTTTESYHKYRNQIDSLALQFIKKHNNSVASTLIILDNYVINPNRKKASYFYQLLSEKNKKSEYGLKIKAYIEAVKNIAVGKIAPDFTLSDTNGNLIHLKNYRGKYVFLDFWASWCGPCRQSHPLMKELFKKYGIKNISFISVSMDVSKSSWINAIRTDKLDWIQLNDSLSMNGYVAETYGIRSLPFNVFINKEGKIIATKLRDSVLVNFINDLF
ncbi:TlpA disulfide reductase family protein [Rhizosphaericola mali]|uniref:AhpC/TSA family protein n=1 Tax=Rhizosphaericola mali TaxID=2545455 RepID=A0A5P2G484_9BACT|nr:TlpA disulfide reductase family protein [Rhizosphaericola mali]QES88570.1 AhpC/TSA family protein [Rhizosphaericola mali]